VWSGAALGVERFVARGECRLVSNCMRGGRGGVRFVGVRFAAPMRGIVGGGGARLGGAFRSGGIVGVFGVLGVFALEVRGCAGWRGARRVDVAFATRVGGRGSRYFHGLGSLLAGASRLVDRAGEWDLEVLVVLGRVRASRWWQMQRCTLQPRQVPSSARLTLVREMLGSSPGGVSRRETIRLSSGTSGSE
jgi:hypothetical protein